jgi:hypothetical protein
VIPGYARSVDGTALDATTIMYKQLSAQRARNGLTGPALR